MCKYVDKKINQDSGFILHITIVSQRIRGTHSKDVADNKCHNNKQYQDTSWYKVDGSIIAEICMTAPAVTESIMDRVIAAVWYCYKETTCKNDIIIRELCKSWDNEIFMVMHLE